LIADPTYTAQLQALRKDMHAFFDQAGAPPLEKWQSTTKQVLEEYQSVAASR